MKPTPHAVSSQKYCTEFFNETKKLLFIFPITQTTAVDIIIINNFTLISSFPSLNEHKMIEHICSQ
jgi:hypothetical protein